MPAFLHALSQCRFTKSGRWLSYIFGDNRFEGLWIRVCCTFCWDGTNVELVSLHSRVNLFPKNISLGRWHHLPNHMIDYHHIMRQIFSLWLLFVFFINIGVLKDYNSCLLLGKEFWWEFLMSQLHQICLLFFCKAGKVRHCLTMCESEKFHHLTTKLPQQPTLWLRIKLTLP